MNDALVGIRRFDTAHRGNRPGEGDPEGAEQRRTGDIVILAGKGHETTRCRDRTIDFDDREVAREMLRGFGYRKEHSCGLDLLEARARWGSTALTGDVSLEHRFPDTQPGDCLLRDPGEVHDGTTSWPTCSSAGCAVVVHQDLGNDPRLIRVQDTLQLCNSLATGRGRWGGTVIGVTGSAGKTTTKDVIAPSCSTSLRRKRSAISTTTSACRSRSCGPAGSARRCARNGNESRRRNPRAGRIARPDIAVVTNVGYAHVENFESIDGVAAAKRELIEAFGRGTAVLNADDERVRHSKGEHGLLRLVARRGRRASVQTAFGSALGAPFESACRAVTPSGTSWPGIAVARVFGIEPGDSRSRPCARARQDARRTNHAQRNPTLSTIAITRIPTPCAR